MLSSRSLGSTVVVVVIVLGVLGYKFHAKGQVGRDYNRALHDYFSHCDRYDTNREYLDSVCDQAHETAFEGAYQMGGRRRSSSFDESKYFTEALAIVVRRAQEDGRKELTESVRRLLEQERPVSPKQEG